MIAESLTRDAAQVATLASILVVEDDADQSTALRRTLESHGFDVTVAADGPVALEVAAAASFDVVLLDLDLPTLSGFEVCRRLRATSPVRIVILSASRTETDRVIGLNLGADDFLLKPLSPIELTTRLGAMLRRRELDGASHSHTQTIGAVSIDTVRHEVRLHGTPVELTPSEFRILALLSREPGRVYTRTEIVQELWHSDFVGDRRSCDVHLRNLRRKLEDDPAYPRHILTVRGVGYRLAA